MDTVNLLMVGAGAHAKSHLKALQGIQGVKVLGIVDVTDEGAYKLAEPFGIPWWGTRYEEGLLNPDVHGVILASPTPLHVEHGLQAMRAGKHVQIEIPVADSIHGVERILDTQRKTGLIAMAGHTRRFSPPHQFVKQRLIAGDQLYYLMVQSCFDRRTNINLEGEPRNWKDNLLWHHACHGVDAALYISGEIPEDLNMVQGPYNPEMETPMNIGITMAMPSGALCSIALSFHSKGPQGTTFRYICDSGTYIARYDELTDGDGKKIDTTGVTMYKTGLEGQDAEFVAAIREGRQPFCCVEDVFDTMETLHRLEQSLG